MMAQSPRAALRSAANTLFVITPVLCLLAGCGAAPESQDPVAVASADLDATKFSGWHLLQSVTPIEASSGAAAVNIRNNGDNLDLYQIRPFDNTLGYYYGHTSNDGVDWSWSLPVNLGTPHDRGLAFTRRPSATSWIPTATGRNGSAVAIREYDSTGDEGNFLRQIWVKFLISGTFTEWSMVDSGDFEEDPAMAFSYPYVYVFAPKSEAGQVQFYFSKNDISSGYNANGWTSWTHIPGGNLVYAGAAAALDNGRLFLAASGTNNRYYIISSTDGGAHWSNWNYVNAGPNTFTSAPALTANVAAGGNIELNIFGTQTAVNGLRLVLNSTSLDGGNTWSSYQSIGYGDLLSAPSAVASRPSRIETFGRGTDGKIYVDNYRE